MGRNMVPRVPGAKKKSKAGEGRGGGGEWDEPCRSASEVQRSRASAGTAGGRERGGHDVAAWARAGNANGAGPGSRAGAGFVAGAGAGAGVAILISRLTR